MFQEPVNRQDPKIPDPKHIPLGEEVMIRSSVDGMKPPTVIKKISKSGKSKHIGLFINHDRFYLSPAEALSLADRLVDAAEEISNED